MASNTSPDPCSRIRATNSTDEFGFFVGVVGQTIRASVCRKGHYLGLIPTKLSNGRLRWDSLAIQRLLLCSGELVTAVYKQPLVLNSAAHDQSLIESSSARSVKGDNDE